MASRDSRSRKGSKKAAAAPPAAPLVSIIMGSKSDWETMRAASEILTEDNDPHDCRVSSAHTARESLSEFCAAAAARGIEVITAGAGGAGYLAGVTAAQPAIP